MLLDGRGGRAGLMATLSKCRRAGHRGLSWIPLGMKPIPGLRGEGASLSWSFRVISRLSPHRTIRVVFGVKNEDQVEGARLGREQCHD